MDSGIEPKTSWTIGSLSNERDSPPTDAEQFKLYQRTLTTASLMRDKLGNPAMQEPLSPYNSDFKMLVLPISKSNLMSDDRHVND